MLNSTYSWQQICVVDYNLLMNCTFLSICLKRSYYMVTGSEGCFKQKDNYTK